MIQELGSKIKIAMGQDHSALIEKAVENEDYQLNNIEDGGCRKRRYSNDLDVFRRKKMKLEGKILYTNYKGNKNDDIIRGCEWNDDGASSSPKSTDSNDIKDEGGAKVDQTISDCKLKQLLVSRPQLGNLLREQLTKPTENFYRPDPGSGTYRGRAHTAPANHLNKIRRKVFEMSSDNSECSRIAPQPETGRSLGLDVINDGDVEYERATQLNTSDHEKESVVERCFSSGNGASAENGISAAASQEYGSYAHIKEEIRDTCQQSCAEMSEPEDKISETSQIIDSSPDKTSDRTNNESSRSANSTERNYLNDLLDKALPNIIHNPDCAKTQEKFNLLYYLHLKNDNKRSSDCVCSGERSILQDLLEKRVKREIESESEDEDDLERPDTPTWLSLYDDNADPAKIAEYASKVKKAQCRKPKNSDSPAQRRHTFSHCLPKTSSKNMRSGSFSGLERTFVDRRLQRSSGGIVQATANTSHSPTNSLSSITPRVSDIDPSWVATSQTCSILNSPKPGNQLAFTGEPSGQCYEAGFSERLKCGDHPSKPRNGLQVGSRPNLIKAEPTDGIPSMPPLIDMGRLAPTITEQGYYQLSYRSEKRLAKDQPFPREPLGSFKTTTHAAGSHYQQREHLFRQQQRNSYYYHNGSEKSRPVPGIQNTPFTVQEQLGIGLHNHGHMPRPFSHLVTSTLGSHDNPLSFLPPVTADLDRYDTYGNQFGLSSETVLNQPEHYTKSTEPVDLSKYSLIGYA